MKDEKTLEELSQFHKEYLNELATFQNNFLQKHLPLNGVKSIFVVATMKAFAESLENELISLYKEKQNGV